MAKDRQRIEYHRVRRLSAKPRKKRKLLYTAPWHVRRKMMSSMLSPELCEKYGIKSVPVREGDTVQVLRGEYRGMGGKVTSVNLKKYRIFVEGIKRERIDGTVRLIPIHPSKVMITKLNLDDKARATILKRKARSEKYVKAS